MSSFDATVEEVAATGRESHRNWTDATYAAFVRGPATRLWKNLDASDADTTATLRAYLTLGVEALARGFISETGEPDGLLGHLWSDLIPRSAASMSTSQLPSQLVDLWNLGEGLRREAIWLDRVVCRGLDQLDALPDVEATLTAIVESVFSEEGTPAWEIPRVATVDCRATIDSFLPGTMHLLAPRVVCIHDRRHRGQHLGLLLDDDGPHVLGHVDCGESFAATRMPPKFSFDRWGQLVLGETPAFLPYIGELYGSLGLGAGHVVATSRSSQRLWVVGYD